MSFVPFTPDEQFVIEAYLNNLPVDASIAAACDRLEVPESSDVLRTAIGAGMILLYSVQDRLPNFSTRNREGEIVFGRTRRRRKGAASLAFIPQHLFTLNRADSGPGISWPESYWAVHVPIHERIVVVASRDGDEPWGCADHAIGHFPVGRSIVPTSGKILQANWRAQIDHHEQGAWAYVWDTGLVEEEKAKAWREQVWGRGVIPPAPLPRMSPDICCHWRPEGR